MKMRKQCSSQRQICVLIIISCSENIVHEFSKPKCQYTGAEFERPWGFPPEVSEVAGDETAQPSVLRCDDTRKTVFPTSKFE
eukprot:6214813-Pleurochrysis_carterae.AAC.2